MSTIASPITPESSSVSEATNLPSLALVPSSQPAFDLSEDENDDDDAVSHSLYQFGINNPSSISQRSNSINGFEANAIGLGLDVNERLFEMTTDLPNLVHPPFIPTYHPTLDALRNCLQVSAASHGFAITTHRSSARDAVTIFKCVCSGQYQCTRGPSFANRRQLPSHTIRTGCPCSVTARNVNPKKPSAS